MGQLDFNHRACVSFSASCFYRSWCYCVVMRRWGQLVRVDRSFFFGCEHMLSWVSAFMGFFWAALLSAVII